jgi:hypothetical protein
MKVYISTSSKKLLANPGNVRNLDIKWFVLHIWFTEGRAGAGVFSETLYINSGICNSLF